VEDYAKQISTRAKLASRKISQLNTKTKNSILHQIADELVQSSAQIIEANLRDLEEGQKKGLSSSLMDRLLLNQSRIESLANAVKEIANLPDPIGVVTRGARLPNGLELITKQVPLGVVLVIYESRPNVTIDVAALAFKSGNSAILRGGSEAIHSNLLLAELFRKVLSKNHIPEDALVFVDKTDRSFMLPLLKQTNTIDIVVPRGGEGLIKYVSENSLIPVVKHDKGVCNMFVDYNADYQKAIPIIINSKAQRPSVCNALENLFIHKDFPKIKELLVELQSAKIELLFDKESLSYFPEGMLATEEDFYTEFLDLRLSVKIVTNLDVAISEITKYSSGHTEAILSEDESNIQKFLGSLDSAALFVNCSTRFHDGGEFGLGAEVGISTGKLHVRGPMGLMHLTTTTTVLRGEGQIRG
jgi:glutamate-5-semialdehyde dehydrogenase